MPTRELIRDQTSFISQAAGQGGQQVRGPSAGHITQGDVPGCITTLKETGPAAGAVNAPQCTGTGWPQVRAYQPFLFF